MPMLYYTFSHAFSISNTIGTVQINEEMLDRGLIGTMIVVFIVVTGYVAKSVRDAKKSYKDSTENTKAEYKESEKRLEQSFMREAKRNKEHYEELLKTKEETLFAVIKEKQNQIDAQKKLYEDMINTRTETLWKPLEEKLKTANSEIIRLNEIITSLNKTIESKRQELNDLSEYEYKFRIAIRYINSVIKSLSDNELNVPEIPTSLQSEINGRFKIPFPEGEHGDIHREGDDIIITTEHEHDYPGEEENDGN